MGNEKEIPLEIFKKLNSLYVVKDGHDGHLSPIQIDHLKPEVIS
jgi:hypothetical protein